MSAGKPEKLQVGYIVSLCGLAFLILGSYAISRPAIESLYLESYGSRSLPLAWLGVAMLAMLVVAIYGRFTERYDLKSVFQGALAVISLLLVCLMGALAVGQDWAVYALYLWKDLYIVVLVEMFWSIANSTFALKSATWIYGLFCVMGSLGGITANLSIGPIAKSIGTENAPWLALPVFILIALICRGLPTVVEKSQVKTSAREDQPDESRGFLAGWNIVRKSDYLSVLLVIIALVQVVITLVDYQYNIVLESAFPGTDARTAVIGQVYAAIDISAMILQLGAGLVISLLGVGGTLMSVPGVLTLCILGFIVSPLFAVMAAAKVASKALDYSLFRAAKELVYLPLNHQERTQGKAVVDILTYRVAKGVASLCLMGLAAANASPQWVTWVALALTATWLALTFALLKQYGKRVSTSTLKTDMPASGE